MVPDRLPRWTRLAPGVVFGGVYSGRGVAASLALGRRIGAWLAGRSTDDAMPLPMTDLRRVPFHPLAVRSRAESTLSIAGRTGDPWAQIKF